jgi:ubiquinone/menaquinone biosynthesis C-methylase UbiE
MPYNAAALDLPDASFDVVLSAYVLRAFAGEQRAS